MVRTRRVGVAATALEQRWERLRRWSRGRCAMRRTSCITVVGMKEANHFRTDENVYYFTIINKNWTKSKIGDRQGVKNLILEALTIVDLCVGEQ